MSEHGNESSSAGSQSHYWRDVPAPFEEHEAMLHLCSAFTGICIAGAVYPLAVCLCLAIYGLFSNGITFNRFGDLFGIVGMVVLLGGFFGVIISSISGLISLIIFSQFNRSMGKPMSSWTIGICAGSLAGYLPTVWLGFFEELNDFCGLLPTLLLGPVLAMTLGILGASWQMSDAKPPTINPRKNANTFQISTRHLFAATTWFAVLFAISNFFDRVSFAIAVVGWIALHFVLTWTLSTFYRIYRQH